MASSPERYKRLIEALPKNNYNITKSALEAGFTHHTARTQQKRLVKSAMKYQVKELAERVENASGLSNREQKQLMSEIVGMSKQDVMERLKFIANQDKDLNSALKVLAPLSKEHGVILQNEDESKINVPILNVVVKEKGENMAQLSDKIVL